ncbi:hypothetical protein DL767_000881 [Monosporascus sp. MG133]|nr:hypothetical protein DL767_000881 [Monosporascus sp. MG133]
MRLTVGLTSIRYDKASSEYSTKAFSIPVPPDLDMNHVQPNTAHGLTKLLNWVFGISTQSLKFLKQGNTIHNMGFRDVLRATLVYFRLQKALRREMHYIAHPEDAEIA